MKLTRKILKQELQDVFNIYLENDIAGDNEDRRNKLQALTEINQIIDKT